MLGAVAAMGAVATPAHAGSCGIRSTTTAFAPFGDSAEYFLAPGGGFESGLGGWFGSQGIGTVWGNEPWNAFGGSYSLLMPQGGRATSPTFCVAQGETAVRLFVKRPGVAYSKMHVEVTVQQASGGVVQSWLDVDGAKAGWWASPIVTIPTAFGTSASEQVFITVSDNGAPAPWVVDDVSVDPVKGN
jgi:hypothetical protein